MSSPNQAQALTNLEGILSMLSGPLPIDRARVAFLQEWVRVQYQEHRESSPNRSEVYIPRRRSLGRFGLPDSLDGLVSLVQYMRETHDRIVGAFPELQDALEGLLEEVRATTRRKLEDALHGLDAPLVEDEDEDEDGDDEAAVEAWVKEGVS